MAKFGRESTRISSRSGAANNNYERRRAQNNIDRKIGRKEMRTAIVQADQDDESQSVVDVVNPATQAAIVAEAQTPVKVQALKAKINTGKFDESAYFDAGDKMGQVNEEDWFSAGDDVEKSQNSNPSKSVIRPHGADRPRVTTTNDGGLVNLRKDSVSLGAPEVKGVAGNLHEFSGFEELVEYDSIGGQIEGRKAELKKLEDSLKQAPEDAAVEIKAANFIQKGVLKAKLFFKVRSIESNIEDVAKQIKKLENDRSAAFKKAIENLIKEKSPVAVKFGGRFVKGTVDSLQANDQIGVMFTGPKGEKFSQLLKIEEFLQWQRDEKLVVAPATAPEATLSSKLTGETTRQTLAEVKAKLDVLRNSSDVNERTAIKETQEELEEQFKVLLQANFQDNVQGIAQRKNVASSKEAVATSAGQTNSRAAGRGGDSLAAPIVTHVDQSGSVNRGPMVPSGIGETPTNVDAKKPIENSEGAVMKEYEAKSKELQKLISDGDLEGADAMKAEVNALAAKVLGGVAYDQNAVGLIQEELRYRDEVQKLAKKDEKNKAVRSEAPKSAVKPEAAKKIEKKSFGIADLDAIDAEIARLDADIIANEQKAAKGSAFKDLISTKPKELRKQRIEAQEKRVGIVKDILNSLISNKTDVKVVVGKEVLTGKVAEIINGKVGVEFPGQKRSAMVIDDANQFLTWQKEGGAVMAEKKKVEPVAVADVAPKAEAVDTKADAKKYSVVQKQLVSAWGDPMKRGAEVQGKFAWKNIFDGLSANDQLKKEAAALRDTWGTYKEGTEAYALQTGEALRQVIAKYENK